MKTGLKWILAGLLCVSMLLGMQMAGAEELRTVQLFGTEYRGYNWMTANDPNVQDYAAVKALNEDLAALGLAITWEAIPNDSYPMTLQMRIASGDQYGMLVNGSPLTDAEAVQYGSDGYFLDLYEVFAKYDPEGLILSYCEENFPGKLNSYTTEDGKLYWMPYLNARRLLDGTTKSGSVLSTSIRKDWLDKLGIEYKYEYSTEEFFDILMAFRDQDANGNGLPDENIGTALSDFDSYSSGGLSNAFGLYAAVKAETGGGLGTGIEREDGTKEWGFVWDSPYIGEFLSYLNRLYEEGLYDLDLLSEGAEERMRNENRGGSSYSYSVWTTHALEVLGVEDAQYAPIRVYYEDPGNNVLVTQDMVNGYNSKYMIPANISEEEIQATVDLLKYVYTDRYVELLFGGAEGVGFHYSEYGEFIRDYTSNVAEKGKVHLDAPLWHCLSGNLLPNLVVEPQSVKRINEELLPEWQEKEDHQNLFQYEYRFTKDGKFDMIREAVAYAIPTEAEAEVLMRVENNLTTYSKELLTAFMMGEASMDKMPEYMAEMESLGMNEYKEVMSARYDRANNAE